MRKTYDRDYFDKWYRDPRHAVGSPTELRRKVALAVAQAGYYLGRPGRNGLDVGCGEGWLARALGPLGIRVHGFDAVPQLIEAARRAGGGTFERLSYEAFAGLYRRLATE